MSDENIERGAAEENSATPVTPTERDASRTPPSRSDSGSGQPELKEHDQADSARSTDV